MLGRSKERTEEAAQDVIATTGVDPAMVHVMIVDLASLQSVRDFAAEFKNSEWQPYAAATKVRYNTSNLQICKSALGKVRMFRDSTMMTIFLDFHFCNY